MKKGRPTKYAPEMITQANKYIDTTKLPTVEGLALELGLDDERISEYSKLYPDFHATIKRLKQKQKMELMTEGFYGGKNVNAVMAIFLLKVNHGMIDTNKLDVEFKGKQAAKAEKDNAILTAIDDVNNNGNTENQ